MEVMGGLCALRSATEAMWETLSPQCLSYHATWHRQCRRLSRPAESTVNTHNTHTPLHHMSVYACVARDVPPKERLSNRKAKASLDIEWNRLRKAGKQGCWDENKVREYHHIVHEVRREQRKAHFGKIFEVCVEKNFRLHEPHPASKFKGRVVYQGNNVRDEHGDAAFFQDLSSCPATMEAAKCADCFAMIDGNVGQQADAEQAYTQAAFRGTETWVRIPKHQWPKHWEGKYTDPVCPLLLALYGHPESGGYWEQHCEAHLLSVGFENIPDWRSCYYHKRLDLFLVV